MTPNQKQNPLVYFPVSFQEEMSFDSVKKQDWVEVKSLGL